MKVSVYHFCFKFHIDFIIRSCQIAPNQFIQSHTILKTLAQKRFEEPVLILGGQLDAAQKVAEEFVICNRGLAQV